MADRTQGERERGEREQGEYGWLYGGRERADRPADDPEPTRVMPTTPRPPSGSAQTDRPAPPRRGVPPRPGRPAPPPPPRRSRPRVRNIVLAVIALWVVFLVAVPLWAWAQVDKVDATPSGARPADQPGTNFLLVGSDSRKGLTKKEQKKLHVGGVGDVGQRTDTIMVLHTGSGPNVLLSIPRDSIVPIPGHETTKINAAFAYGGPKLLVKTIEQDTGLYIDHYVEVGFGGFVNAVDAVGGVTICPHANLNDRRSGLHVKKGCQEVDGATALAFARDRHSFGLGDVQRGENQRKVVAAVGHKIKSPWTFLNPVRYFRLNQAAVSSLKVGNGTGPVAMAKFALAMASGGKTCTMPISDLAIHWDRPRALALIKLLKEDRSSDIGPRLCTKSGLPR
ncbi:MAG TPA: LCP family protein [Marmoricola sp.]|nr:LCP family protein [Marmoricola sp.]